MSDFPDLVELCKGHNIYIQTHNFPDQIGRAHV